MSPHNKHLTLILGAHPDDGALGAGGLAAQLGARGGRVVLLTATLGELGGDPLTRKAEDIAAARILGVEPHYGELRDGRVTLRSAIRLVENAVGRFKPTTVLVHHPRDSHQDHAYLSRATVAACRQVPNLIFYEGPTSQCFCPSIVIDISAVWRLKREALLAYQSQLPRVDLIRWADSASRFRSWPRYGRRARCEGLHLHRADLWSLFDALDGR
jgi:LmbE family N-acetylglucosaminyl deacetylase